MIDMEESDCYRSWFVSSLVGFLPRLKPWASSLHLCDEMNDTSVLPMAMEGWITVGVWRATRWSDRQMVR
ncbi:hypothetical protein C5C07_19840 [Haloferax sp. Atlit-4N]|nr:hypothetical protein C5C07_19840 [Haloferax sp. Atlit-4N]